MNKKQKNVIVISLSVIIVSIIIWQIYGGEIFTKTQVLVETKDELFGWTEKKWEDKFIWGLDLSLLISGITVIIGGLFFYLSRNKKSLNQ